jgi:hypothetical protein
MRLVIAAAMFVVSIMLGLVGVGQRTIWAPPASVSISTNVQSTSPYVVLQHSLLAKHSGKPHIIISGGSAFIASGREADVEAFIGKTSQTTVGLDAKGAQLATNTIIGGAQGVSPVGSDLWRDSISGTGKTTLVADASQDGAVVIASDGIAAAPQSVQIVWPIANDLFWSNLLLIFAGALLLAAVILNVIVRREDRLKNGPRRRLPKAPSGPKYRPRRKARFAPARGRRAAGRRAMVIPASLATLALLAGCSTAHSTSASSPSASPNATKQAPPVVIASQLQRILADVASAANAADLNNDKKLLEPRFTGPALNLRAVHYFLRSKDKTVPALPAIVARPISFSLPAATSAWPRTIMAVTDEPGQTALPQLIVLQQADPRSNYQVWYTVRLMPGAKIPEVPAASSGAIPVGAKSLFLKVPPLSLPASYGDLINKGQSSLSAQLFDVSNDEFYKQVSTSQQQQVTNLKNGKITFTHALGDSNVLALSTSQAGALVAVYMTDTYVIKPTKQGSAVGVSGQEALILGGNGSSKGVRSIYGNMMLFYVPALSSNSKIRLIGVTQGLVSVRSL